jgi:glycosylphosphatidylinositol transamidase
MFLSSLATLNFSLAFLVGLFSTPLSFAHPWPDNVAMRYGYTTLLNLVSPTAVVLAGAAAYASSYEGAVELGVSGSGLLSALEGVLKEAAFGWDVWGLYIPVVVWCVWWPAWLVGSIVVLGQPKTKVKKS